MGVGQKNAAAAVAAAAAAAVADHCSSSREGGSTAAAAAGLHTFGAWEEGVTWEEEGGVTWEEEGVACSGSWTVLQHKQLQLVQQLLLVHKSQQRTAGHVAVAVAAAAGLWWLSGKWEWVEAEGVALLEGVTPAAADL